MKHFLTTLLTLTLACGTMFAWSDDDEDRCDSLLWRSSNPAAVIDYCNQYLFLNPRDQRAYYWMAESHVSSGDSVAAFTNYDLAIKYAGNRLYKANNYRHRGYGYERFGDLNKALKDYTKSIKTKPTERSYLYRADTYEQLEDIDKALNDYLKAFKLNPDNSHALTRIAIDLFNYDSDRDPEALKKLLNRAIEIDPDNTDAYLYRCLCYALQDSVLKSADDAIEYFLRAGKLDERFNQIIPILQQYAGPYLLALINKNFVTHFSMFTLRGNTYFHMKKYRECITDIDAAERLMDGHLDMAAAATRATAYTELGEHDKAIKDYTYIIDVLGKDAYAARANAYISLGRSTEALRDLDSAIALSPDDQNKVNTIQMVQGIIYIEQKEYDKAFTILQQCLETDPNLIAAHYAIGNIYLQEKHDTISAYKHYETVVRIEEEALAKADSDEERATLEESAIRHYALCRLGRTDEGFALMEKRLEDRKHDYESLYDAACLQALFGDQDKAIYYLHQSLRKGYNDYHHIMNDSDLDSLRHREDFQLLMEKYFPQMF